MTAAFERRYELTLAKQAKGAGFFDAVLPNAIIIRGMEIKFKIERSLEPTPNGATIDVFNLADNTRVEFQKKPLRVRLDVGYARQAQLSRLIEGDLMFSGGDRKDGNVITSFTVGDGERSYVEARVSRSLTSGVNIKSVIGEIASSMGLKLPTSVADATALLKQYSGGATLHGPSRDQMTKALRGTGYGWSIQDGALQILRDTDTRAGFAEIVSPSTGLVGSPEYGASHEANKPPVLKFKVVLRPGLVPGGRVKVESAEVNGFFRLTKIIHTGDFRDNDWYSECESNPL